MLRLPPLLRTLLSSDWYPALSPRPLQQSSPPLLLFPHIIPANGPRASSAPYACTLPRRHRAFRQEVALATPCLRPCEAPPILFRSEYLLPVWESGSSRAG